MSEAIRKKPNFMTHDSRFVTYEEYIKIQGDHEMEILAWATSLQNGWHDARLELNTVRLGLRDHSQRVLCQSPAMDLQRTSRNSGDQVKCLPLGVCLL